MATDDMPTGARALKGRWLLSRGMFKEAVAEFEAAGTPMTDDQLLDYAMACLSRGWARVAAMAVFNIELQPSYEDWLECGRLCVDRGWLEDAQQAYASAGRELPRKGVIACGYKILEGGDIDAALEAFKEADSAKGYVACGKAYLQYHSYHEGVDCYALANKPAPAKLLAECGMYWLMAGALDLAREAFAAAGRPITREMWIEAGNRLMYREWGERADIAYTEAERLR